MGFGWPSGMRPNTSMTSRSNQFATGYFAAIEGTMVHSEAPGPRPGGRTAGSATTTRGARGNGRSRLARRSRRATGAVRSDGR